MKHLTHTHTHTHTHTRIREREGGGERVLNKNRDEKDRVD